jgi:hypothetical protein
MHFPVRMFGASHALYAPLPTKKLPPYFTAAALLLQTPDWQIHFWQIRYQ